MNISTLSGDEYLWEWGGFPQKTPLKTTFGLPGTSDTLGSGWDKDNATGFPLDDSGPGTDVDEEEAGYGSGGRLRPDRNEPYRFILLIERKTTYFELALFPKDEPRRKFGRNEVDDAQTFNERRIEYSVFLDDTSIFQKGDLVIRWAGDRYVHSPIHWGYFQSLPGASISGISLVPMDLLSWTLCQSGGNLRSSTGTKGQFRVPRPLPRVQRVMMKNRCHRGTKAPRTFLKSKMRGRLRCHG